MNLNVLISKAKYSSEIIIKYSPTPMVTDLGVLVLMMCPMPYLYCLNTVLPNH